MRGAVVVVLSFLCLGASPAAAQDLTPILQLPKALEDLKGAKADSAAAVSASQGAEQDAAPILKEHKLWEDQLTALKPKYDAYNKTDLPAYEGEVARYNPVADRHNATCPKVVNDNGQLARCQGEYAQLSAWKSRLDDHKAKLQQELAQLDKQRDPILKRSKELEDKFQPIKQRWDEANAKQQEAAKRIDALKARIAAAYQLCRALLAQPPQPDLSKDVGEALHLCASVPFDNADSSLPPLTDIRPPSGATTNQ
ncbi:MAG: hypothetical protein ABSG83_09930 [Roseiarcus sp.]|jgi:chromosome segregation ATPase